MVEAGGFDEIEDFGFVRKDEMTALFANPPAMLETVRERRAEYDQLCLLIASQARLDAVPRRNPSAA